MVSSSTSVFRSDFRMPSRTVQEGLDMLETVLRLIRDAGLKLNLAKCSFLKESIEYLGHEVSGEGVRPGQRKTTAVMDFPVPTDVHKVRQFIGLASYFRKFVKNFSTVARPLTDLTKKDRPWSWGKSQQAAFDELRKVLSARPVLAIYRNGADTELHTDASKKGLGGILLQKQADEQLKPVAYFSRATTSGEEQYHSYEREPLALGESLRRFRVYLVGHHFKVVTDCAALRATLMKRDLVPRIARWWLAIQDYDFDVEYRPGNRMQHVDALSRNPVRVNLVNTGEEDWFLTVQLQDHKTREILEALRSEDGDPQLRKEFRAKAGRVYRRTTDGDRLFVPAMARFNLVKQHHDDVGHPGVERCLALIKEVYWFPKMGRFVCKYVRSCLRCAFAKSKHGRGEGQLHPYERQPVPFDTVHIDHLGPFMRSARGCSYLLVLVDGFTKFVIAKPTKSLRSTEALDKLKDIFSLFGFPRRIISDRGLAFTSRAFKAFVAERGIRHVYNAVATPRANGQVERANSTIVEALTASAVDERHWDEKLANIIWGINNTINASTRYSPARLMFAHTRGLVTDLSCGGEQACEPNDGDGGRMEVGEATDEGVGVNKPGEQGGDDSAAVDGAPRDDGSGEGTVQLGDDSVRKLPKNVAPSQTDQLGKRRQTASENIRRTAKRKKERYDKKRGKARQYQRGDLVLWRRAAKVPEPGVTKKLIHKYGGPYRVTRVLPYDRYQISSIRGLRGYKRFTATAAVDALKPYASTQDVGESGGDDSGASDREIDRLDLIDLLES